MISDNPGATRNCWGRENLSLDLPACTVELRGLSTAQKQRIATDYEAFLPGNGAGSQRPDVVCHASPLHQPLTLPAAFFTVHGEYAPHIKRAGSQVEIVGYDSFGTVDRADARPARATLAVAAEDVFPRAFVLENFLRIVAAYQALDRRGALLHSVAVVRDERAFLFCGRSNAGKTTLARKAAAGGAQVLSDDINLVMPARGQYRVHRVPFTGEFGRPAFVAADRVAYPLDGMALLGKGESLSASPIRPARAVAGLLAGCPFVNGDPEELPVLMRILADLVASTRVLSVGVGRDDSFVAIMTAIEEAGTREQ